MRFDWSELGSVLAQAYFDAAKSAADMRAAANAFESVRTGCAAPNNILQTRAAFFDQIGRADSQRIVPLLCGLRDRWEQAASTYTVMTVKHTFDRDAAGGWQSWLDLYAQTFDERSWWKNLGCELAESLPSSMAPDWPPQRIRAAARHALRGEWSENLEWVVFLAGQQLPPARRAFFFAIAAEIEIFRFARPARAKRFLDQADAIDAKAPTVCRAWAEYWNLVQEPSRARARYQELVGQRPDLSDGFLGLAECHDNASERNLAETFYQQAVANAPGAYDAHHELLRWHSRTEWFATREALLAPIVSRMLSLSNYPAGTHSDVAWMYYRNKRYDDARVHFQRALELDPCCSGTCLGLGYCDMDEAGDAQTDDARKLRANARAHFERAASMLPIAVENAWALSRLAEREQKLGEALDWCDRALRCHEGWWSTARARKADLLREAGQLEAAHEEITQGIATADSVSIAALEATMSLALAFGSRGDRKTALSLLERWREIRGDGGEARFQNNVGHLFYRDGEYAEAARRYQLAAAANPHDQVLHSNIALALERSRVPGKRADELHQATEALKAALELEPQDADYLERMRALQVEERFLAACGEKTLHVELHVTPIRVELGTALLPAILDKTDSNLLSQEAMRRVDALRDDIHKSFGVRLPGFLFAPLPHPLAGRNYRAILMGNEQVDALLPEPAAGANAFLDALFLKSREILTERLDRFMRYEETVAFLSDAGEGGAALAGQPGEVIRFGEMLRSLLRARKPLLPVEDTLAKFAPLRSDSTPPAPLSTTPRRGTPVKGEEAKFPGLVLRLTRISAKETDYIRETLDEVSDLLFQRIGVVAPRVVLRTALGIRRSAVLDLDDKELGAIDTINPAGSITQYLEKEAERLVVPNLVEFYLDRLNSRAPSLVSALRTTLPLPALVDSLRSRVARGQSIRDLAGVLEQVLAESVPSLSATAGIRANAVSEAAA